MFRRAPSKCVFHAVGPLSHFPEGAKLTLALRTCRMHADKHLGSNGAQHAINTRLLVLGERQRRSDFLSLL